MDFMNTFRLALRALARNKMRSALTMLGIIIGVGAVIAVVSIGQGANYLVQQGIAAMGTNAVFIAAGSNRAGGVRQGDGGGGEDPHQRQERHNTPRTTVQPRPPVA